MTKTGYKRTATFLITVLAVVLVAYSSASAQTDATFTVTNTNGAGAGSLRQAIVDANNNNNDPVSDTIKFNISGGGVKTITSSALPAITEAVTIDGYTQPTSVKNTNATGAINASPLIELNGTGAGSAAFGLDVNTSNVAIKGLVINRFGNAAIRLNSGTGHRIEGDFIGTDPSGTIARPNGNGGIAFTGASATTIGGTNPEARNLISGNASTGIEFNNFASGVEIQGNLIGTQKNATSPLGNDFAGVFIRDDDGNIIGGTEAGAANVIAHNDGDGIIINFGGVGNRILGNSIFSNGTTPNDLGIDLNGDGPTLNDPKDKDPGSNNLQNFPEIASAVGSPGTTTITGTLNSNKKKSFTIQFYASPVADSSGFGEGQTLVGETTVKTNKKGKRDFVFTASQDLSGQFVTATSTNNKTGDTSEFSGAALVS